MINILREPDMSIQCERCGCNFSFLKEDVHVEKFYRHRRGIMELRYVLCPICDKRTRVFN